MPLQSMLIALRQLSGLGASVRAATLALNRGGKRAGSLQISEPVPLVDLLRSVSGLQGVFDIRFENLELSLELEVIGEKERAIVEEMRADFLQFCIG
ncbi:MAG: hypothetical protein ABDH61_03050 [Acidilobaceae archaeon]